MRVPVWRGALAAAVIGAVASAAYQAYGEARWRDGCGPSAPPLSLRAARWPVASPPTIPRSTGARRGYRSGAARCCLLDLVGDPAGDLVGGRAARAWCTAPSGGRTDRARCRSALPRTSRRPASRPRRPRPRPARRPRRRRRSRAAAVRANRRGWSALPPPSSVISSLTSSFAGPKASSTNRTRPSGRLLRNSSVAWNARRAAGHGGHQ